MDLILKDGTRFEVDSEESYGSIAMMACSHENLLGMLAHCTAENMATYQIDDAGTIIRTKSNQVAVYNVESVRTIGGYNYILRIDFRDKTDMDILQERLELAEAQITELQEAIVEGAL